MTTPTNIDELREIVRHAMESVKPLHYKWTEHDDRELDSAVSLIHSHTTWREAEARIDELEHFDGRLLAKMSELEANRDAMNTSGDARWYTHQTVVDRIAELQAAQSKERGKYEQGFNSNNSW